MTRLLKTNNIFPCLTKIYFFLCGFFLCQDIFNLFTYGSTVFNVSYLFLIPGIIVFAFKDKGRIFKSFSFLPSAFIIFLFSIIISVPIGLIYAFINGSVATIFKSFLFFILSSVVSLFFGFIFLKKHKQNIADGVLFGFLLSFILSFIAFLSFQIFGFPLSLKFIFKNEHFYMPNYVFRSQGMFLEPSYMTCFLIVASYFLFWAYKNNILRVFVEMITIFMFFTSGSGNLIIFVFSQIILCVFFFRSDFWKAFKNKMFDNKKRKTIAVSLLVLAVCAFALLIAFPLRSKIISLFEGANPFTKENSERFNCVYFGLALFIRNPWGVGFGYSGTMILKTFKNATLGTTFNYLIKVMAEQGVIGMISYLWLFGLLVFRFFYQSKNEKYLIGICLLSIFFVSTLTGVFNTFSWILVGYSFTVVKEENLFFKFFNKNNKYGLSYSIDI